MTIHVQLNAVIDLDVWIYISCKHNCVRHSRSLYSHVLIVQHLNKWCYNNTSTITQSIQNAAIATTSPIQDCWICCPGLPVSVLQCTDVSSRRLSAHRCHQHVSILLNRHGSVCCSTVIQLLRRLAFRNFWTTPVELITFWTTTMWQSRTVQTVAEDTSVQEPQTS